MIKTIGDFLKDLGGATRPRGDMGEDDIHLVSAILMAEVMVSDGADTTSEIEYLKTVLSREFHLPEAQVEEITALARTRADQATSLFEFTDQVNKTFTNEEKFSLVGHLWQIAYADGRLDKLEESTIRKIAELIHLSHSDFIRAKHLARD
jgi:uncharacterized tellurite resistance protein B-like protein